MNVHDPTNPLFVSSRFDIPGSLEHQVSVVADYLYDRDQWETIYWYGRDRGCPVEQKEYFEYVEMLEDMMHYLEWKGIQFEPTGGLLPSERQTLRAAVASVSWLPLPRRITSRELATIVYGRNRRPGNQSHSEGTSGVLFSG